MLFLAIILIFIGLTMLIRPSLIWAITESWKSNDATEPSDLYKLSTRFGGVMFTLIGIGLCIAYVFI
ncbi:DUF6199 family natural product biosynthesis protein [Paenibacillus hodogayensis]|uniref:DUF6199 family natural product biosynthesis protein n=1 Tax=Paenibacillus hodogayensis TaxID=279208 RepID=A0ABV5W8D2_9BACL